MHPLGKAIYALDQIHLIQQLESKKAGCCWFFFFFFSPKIMIYFSYHGIIEPFRLERH